MKDWFQQNRWLGTFLIVSGICTLLVIYFWFSSKSRFNETLARFNDAAAEKNRLESLNPFPSEANNRKLKIHIENYRAMLEKLKEELKTYVLPAPALAPNEFQSRLRQAMVAVAEKARANKVKLPENFALGFDEFTAALPNTAAAPLLGQELSQIELLLNILIEGRVDGIGGFVRAPLPEERAAPNATPTPGAGPRRKPPAGGPTGSKLIERAVVDITFASTPSAARKVLNQISSSRQQFYIMRILHVRNEKDKGPSREPGPGAGIKPSAAAAVIAATTTPEKPSAALSFIVGNEHIETSARIEIVRFTF